MADGSRSSFAAAGVPQKQQSTLDTWIEPSLPDPVPSYKDRPNLKIPAFGVLTHMAPLGTLPNSKMQKIAKTDTTSKARPKNGGGASASSVSTPIEEETITPDPMPNPSKQMPEPHKEEEEVVVVYQPPPPVTPPAPKAAQAPSMMGYGAGPSFTSLHNTPSQPSFYGLSRPPPTMTIPRPTSASFFTSSMPRPPVRLQEVVLSAIRSARGAGRHHTAFALTDLITNNRGDANVERVLRAVASSGGNIPPSLMSEFSAMVQQKKRESRRKVFTERRESSFAGTGFRFATPSYNSPSRNAPAISGTPILEQHGASRSSPILLSSPTATPPPPRMDDDAHVDKKLKSNDFAVSHEIEAELPEPASDLNLDLNGNDTRQSLSDASRSSSPLSDLDLDDLMLEEDSGPFAPAPVEPDEPEIIEEIKGRRAPKKKKKTRVAPPRLKNISGSKAVASSLSPSLPLLNNTRAHKKTPSSVPQKLDPNDARELMKKKARQITESNGEPFSQSDVRTPMTSHDFDSLSEAETVDASIVLPARKGLQRLHLRHDPKPPAKDDSDKSSPTLFAFQKDLAPASSTNSRQSTPIIWSRPTRKAKPGHKIKTSPMKNRTNPLAGISRASGERNSPVGNGGFGPTQDDNHDDYCSSCGGHGTIVCCDGDGCRRSYHWVCLDPPRSEEDVDPTESIFCSACTSIMRPERRRATGLFAPLLNQMDKTPSAAFRLSKDISEYFEGVKTGLQGEYEDILPAAVQRTKNRAGYEEAPDYLRLKDSKGNVILCHGCQRSAASGQSIIPCSFCSLHWHLDCLDPPLSNPPIKDRAWRCPCHVQDVLDKIPGQLGPAHKNRKIKNSSAMPPDDAAREYHRNNGHIEIENEESGDERESSAFYNKNVFGKEYRLPERGIKLNFLTKIREERMRAAKKAAVVAQEQLQPAPAGPPMSLRSVHEQQAILNLAQLASSAVDFRYDNHTLSSLINALISQAPDNVVALMAQADATYLEQGRLRDSDQVSISAFKNAVEQLLKNLEKASDQGKKVALKEDSEDSTETVSAERQQEEVVVEKIPDDDTEMLL